jgi:hypothetical protein
MGQLVPGWAVNGHTPSKGHNDNTANCRCAAMTGVIHQGKASIVRLRLHPKKRNVAVPSPSVASVLLVGSDQCTVSRDLENNNVGMKAFLPETRSSRASSGSVNCSCRLYLLSGSLRETDP